ncbi:type IVB secretion system protein IcmH/DotU [Noviherbaspirillum denitrificans]|uniref:type IVB secretion system protein IcmH/DotU n=1 Tax=Noviherbaspirillum denitrificans TaxID=1968433 RepID=UPI000B533DA0|nr:type IVB secretion system protein IcmH/DotU [Noviherbaspirillum denitrificans]
MNSIAIAPSTTASPAAHAGFTLSLKDLLEDGIYLLFLLQNGNAPNSVSEFNKRIDQFLSQFEKNARNLGKPAQAVADAKYAICALMDEIVLSSDFSLREEWERAPLQLRMFGEHLAGDRFFDKLEILRSDPAANIEALEVFHTCLLLGFQGKYLLEGKEKLNYLIGRVTQEITQVRGGKAEFAPNWKLPQRFQQYVRHELPLWLFFSLLAVVGVAVFLLYFTLLGNAANELRDRQARPAPAAPVQAASPGTGKMPVTM